MKKSLLFFGVCFVLVTILFGCATTKITSFRDPDYAGKKFLKICVFSSSKNLDTRQMMERTFARILAENGTSATAHIDIFPPTKDLDEEASIIKMREMGYDAVLSINLTGAYTETSTTPGYSSTFWGKKGSTTIYSGPGQVNKPRASFDIFLVDLSTNQKAWTSSTFTAGNAYAGKMTIVDSLARSTIEDLKKQGLVVKPPEKEMASEEKKE